MTLNNDLFLYNKHYIKQIKKTCLPLSADLGIDYYGYHKIYKNGKYFYCSNNLELTEDFISCVKSLVLLDEGEVLKLTNNNHRILWLDNYSNKCGVQTALGSKYRIFSMLYICKVSTESREMWWFSAKGYDYDMMEFCKKNASVFLTFTNHFNYEMQDFLLKKDNYLASFNNSYDFGPLLLEQDSWKNRRVSQQNLDSFMQTMLNKGFPVKARDQILRLTSAELNCMQLLSRYSTAKEVANRLTVSHRTVESHLYNIKKKLGYNSKSDIISFFQDNISYLVPEDLYKLETYKTFNGKSS